VISLQVHEAAKSKQNLYHNFIFTLETAAGDSFFNQSCLEPVPSGSLNMLAKLNERLVMLVLEAKYHVAIIAI
jgi:hypothetical protein